jgi:hypothetical protein
MARGNRRGVFTLAERPRIVACVSASDVLDGDTAAFQRAARDEGCGRRAGTMRDERAGVDCVRSIPC